MGRGTTLEKRASAAWEEHLVLRAQAGESVAMELIADSYRNQIRGNAIRMLRDNEDAEDAVQDTFVKAFKAIRTFEPGRPLLPWLMRICSNCSVDIIRGRKQGQECLEKHEHLLCDTKADVARGVESRMRIETVQRAISRLPDKYRKIIEMRHYNHMDVNEIAVELNIPEGTIKSWLFRARALLKKDLQVALG